jgi:AcrR family transcriptional regulator
MSGEAARTGEEQVSDEVTVVDERTLRILRAAIDLAEEGGFTAVRLRDVAQASGVALGTLYKRFRSKEDLLIGVINHELEVFRGRLGQAPKIDDRSARLMAIFVLLTDFLVERPHFGRAVVRSAAAGEQALASRLSRFHHDLGAIVVGAYLGGEARMPSEDEITLVSTLQRVWFALLVGWAGGINSREEVLADVEKAAALMIRGCAGARADGG